MREELEKQDKSEMKVVTLLPVLGTLVREGGNGMEEALARIRTVRGRKILKCLLQESSILMLPSNSCILVHIVQLYLKSCMYIHLM